MASFIIVDYSIVLFNEILALSPSLAISHNSLTIYDIHIITSLNNNITPKSFRQHLIKIMYGFCKELNVTGINLAAKLFHITI